MVLRQSPCKYSEIAAATVVFSFVFTDLLKEPNYEHHDGSEKCLESQGSPRCPQVSLNVTGC